MCINLLAAIAVAAVLLSSPAMARSENGHQAVGVVAHVKIIDIHAPDSSSYQHCVNRLGSPKGSTNQRALFAFSNLSETFPAS